MQTHSVTWDRVGIGLSGICAIHCLSLPVLLATVPLWPMAEQLHALLHPVFAALLIPTTLAAAWIGWREHNRKDVVALLSIGLVVVLLAGVLGHERPGGVVETVLTLAGSTLLITGHWRNWSAHRRCHAAVHS